MMVMRAVDDAQQGLLVQRQAGAAYDDGPAQGSFLQGQQAVEHRREHSAVVVDQERVETPLYPGALIAGGAPAACGGRHEAVNLRQADRGRDKDMIHDESLVHAMPISASILSIVRRLVMTDRSRGAVMSFSFASIQFLSWIDTMQSLTRSNASVTCHTAAYRPGPIGQ